MVLQNALPVDYCKTAVTLDWQRWQQCHAFILWSLYETELCSENGFLD